MKVLVVHADGVVAEDTGNVPSIDPWTAGIDLVKTLADALAWPLYVLCDTQRLEHMRQWLHALGIKPMRIVPTEGLSADDRARLVISMIGESGSTIGLYISSHPYECSFVSSNGYPAIMYHAPQRQGLGWGPEPGHTWSTIQQQLQQVQP